MRFCSARDSEQQRPDQEELGSPGHISSLFQKTNSEALCSPTVRNFVIGSLGAQDPGTENELISAYDDVSRRESGTENSRGAWVAQLGSVKRLTLGFHSRP